MIGGGALMLARLLTRVGPDAAVTVSEADILDGHRLAARLRPPVARL